MNQAKIEVINAEVTYARKDGRDSACGVIRFVCEGAPDMVALKAILDGDSQLAWLSNEEGRWIKVSERLPEEGQKVMIYGPMQSLAIHGVATTIRGGVGDAFEVPGLITHWLPLPDPPQREEGEE